MSDEESKHNENPLPSYTFSQARHKLMPVTSITTPPQLAWLRENEYELSYQIILGRIGRHAPTLDDLLVSNPISRQVLQCRRGNRMVLVVRVVCCQRYEA